MSLLVGGVILTAVVFGLGWRCPACHSRTEPKASPSLQEKISLAPEIALDRQLDEKREILQARIWTRKRIALDLIEGKTTLRQAAGNFRDLAKEAPARNLVELRLYFPNVSDEELFCRQVLLFVEMEARDRPEQKETVTRLKKELQEALGNGTLSLP
jgi:hypothetical protein